MLLFKSKSFISDQPLRSHYLVLSTGIISHAAKLTPGFTSYDETDVKNGTLDFNSC